jgi:hypothetical protein
MPSTFSLAPSPKWYFVTAEGRPASGGLMYTYSSLNPTVPKPVYSDPAGTFPYINPIQLDGSGGTPVPIYWEFTGVANDYYYVVIRDEQGRIIASVNDFPLIEGGSAPITQNVDIENHFINGQFQYTVNDLFGGGAPEALSLPMSLAASDSIAVRVAPGGGSIDSIVPGEDYVGGSNFDNTGELRSSDLLVGWIFVKESGGGITDNISFVETDVGVGLPLMPGSNAPRYFEYEATGTASATDLRLSYIIYGVRNFSDETVTISFDANATVGSSATAVTASQFFGNTGGSASVVTSTPFTFPNSGWERKQVTINVPSVAGKSLGSANDDYISFDFNIPTNTIGKFQLANLQLQRGTFGGTQLYIPKTSNQVVSEILSELINGHLFKTGDFKLSINPYAPVGWISLTETAETIGSTASGATFSGECMRNLYILLWNTYSDAYAPVTTGRGASATADFSANKSLRFPDFPNRTVAAAGAGITGASGVGQGDPVNEGFLGSETHQLLTAELTPHTHTLIEGGGLNPVTIVPDTVTSIVTQLTEGQAFASTALSIGSTGGGDAFSIMQPTTFLYCHIKL